jgi:hypothetical protein
MLVGTSYKIGTFEKLYSIKYQKKYSDFMLHLRYSQTNTTFNFWKSRKLATVVNFCFLVWWCSMPLFPFTPVFYFNDVRCTLSYRWLGVQLNPHFMGVDLKYVSNIFLVFSPNLWHLLGNLWWHMVAVWIELLFFRCRYFSLFANGLVDPLIINIMLPFSIVR